jgi:hypothetical protein
MFVSLSLLFRDAMFSSTNTLKFTMNQDASCEATAEVTVYDHGARKFRMAVVVVRGLS